MCMIPKPLDSERGHLEATDRDVRALLDICLSISS